MATYCPPVPRPLFALVAALLAPAIVTGCGDHVVVSPVGDIETGHELWSGVDTQDYTFVIDSTCGEASLQGLYRVTVVADDVDSLEPLDETAEASGARPSAALTIDDLFAEISRIKLDDVDLLNANYHVESGYPTYFAVDPDEDVSGDEICYTLSSVHPS